MGTSLYILITGIVGSNPQIQVVGELRVARFSIAVHRDISDDDKQTQWVQVNCWNKLADLAYQHIYRGSLVQVTAEWLRLTPWLANNGMPYASLNLDAHRLILLDRQDDEPQDDTGMWF